MKNPINAYLFLLVAFLISLAGCSSKDNQPASFRVGQFFLNSEKATVTVYDGANEIASLQLKYGQLSEYQAIAAKTYTIKIWIDGALLLEKKMGMGRNGKYTLVLTGIPEKNQPVNKESFINTLYSIAEGAEAITANNFLPQLIIHDDFYIEEKNRGKVSLTHLLPGTVPVAVSFVKDGKEIKLDAVRYPENGKLKIIETGIYHIQLHLNGNPQATALGQETIEDGVLYSLYLIPDPDKYVTNPKLVIGKNRKPE